MSCSGDVDGIVPVLGTRRWIDSLKLPITHSWRPWYSSTGQELTNILKCPQRLKASCKLALYGTPRVCRHHINF